MRINELRPARGAKKKSKRVGRGTGSGHGKTSGRGMKGLFSRSGGGLRAGFEGGQMPLIRRLPKRGFTNIFKKEYQVVNVSSLNIFKDGDVVDLGKLKEKNLIKGNMPVKILGDGELKRKIEIEAHKLSKAAVEKITKAGGSIKLVQVKRNNA